MGELRECDPRIVLTPSVDCYTRCYRKHNEFHSRFVFRRVVFTFESDKCSLTREEHDAAIEIEVGRAEGLAFELAIVYLQTLVSDFLVDMKNCGGLDGAD